MTQLDLPVSRRAALAALGAAGLAGGLAACGSGGKSAGTPGGTSSTVPGGTGAATPVGPQPLVRLDAIPVGSAVSATLDGKPVIISRPAAATVACFSAVCTHMGCTVAPAGKQLHCPCHGSVYDATTGQVISGPAPKPLPEVAVTVENGEVVPDSPA